MKYDFDSPVSRRDSNSIKWESPQLLKNMEISNILPLWVADMDFVVAEPIRQALLKRVQHGVFGYSYVDESYYQAIISWYQRRHAFAIDRESICFSPGIVPGHCLFTAPAHAAGGCGTHSTTSLLSLCRGDYQRRLSNRGESLARRRKRAIIVWILLICKKRPNKRR